MITVKLLVDLGTSPDVAARWAPELDAACSRFQINTPLRTAAFVAEVAHESTSPGKGPLTGLVESLYYRDPARILATFPSAFTTVISAAQYTMKPVELANRAYANRYGNRDEASGDGWKYRGRGPIQITFQANYARMGELCGRPFAEQPDLLLQPGDGSMSAGAYWLDRNLNPLADAGDIDGCTKKINRGMAGAAHRRDLYRLALVSLGVNAP